MTYTHTIDGATLTNDEVQAQCSFVEYHFGILHRGCVVYKSRWLNTYQSAYTIDSTHATEARKLLGLEVVATC